MKRAFRSMLSDEFHLKIFSRFLADLLADWLTDSLISSVLLALTYDIGIAACRVSCNCRVCEVVNSARFKQRLKWNSLRYVTWVSFSRLTRSKPNKEEKDAVDEVSSWKSFKVDHPFSLSHRSFKASGWNPNRENHTTINQWSVDNYFIPKINIRTLSRRLKTSRHCNRILVNNARLCCNLMRT